MRASSAAAVVACMLCGPVAPAGAGERTAFLDAAHSLVDTVQQRFGAGVRILRFAVYADEASIDVQDPAVASHVDRYGYREGSLTGPEPVPVGRNARQVKARSFPLAEVDLSVLPEAMRAAVGAVQAEDGRVTHAAVERAEGWNTDSTWGRPIWRVHVEGPRGGGYAEFRLDGRRGRVVKW